MKQINFTCPNCGSNINIVSMENQVANDHICVFNTSASTSKPDTPKKSAADKIEALRKAGVDVSNLFSITGSNGGEAVARLVDGNLSIVPEDDPIFISILSGDTVPNRRLFRRWVMAQVFHMMTETDWRNGRVIGFTEALNRKGFRYQWRMLEEEFRVQAKLHATDMENFYERNRWFNRDVAVDMAQQYIDIVQEEIKGSVIRKCKGIPYIHLGSRNIFCSDLVSKINRPLIIALHKIKGAANEIALYKAVHEFHTLVKSILIRSDLPLNRAFKDAYKGAGAYFTLKNLILFHGCTFREADGHRLDKCLSLLLLNDYLNDLKMPGYKLFGVLKEFLNYNGVNIAAKQAAWRNKRLANK